MWRPEFPARRVLALSPQLGLVPPPRALQEQTSDTGELMAHSGPGRREQDPEGAGKAHLFG